MLIDRLKKELSNTFGNYYSLSFDRVDAFLGFNTLSFAVYDPVFTTDTSLSGKSYPYPPVFFHADVLHIKGISISGLVFGKELSINTLDLEAPDLLFFTNRDTLTHKVESKKTIQSFSLDHFRIKDGKVRITTRPMTEDTVYYGEGIDLSLDYLNVITDSLRSILYSPAIKNMAFSMNKVKYKPGGLYYYMADSLNVDLEKETVIAKEVKLLPTSSMQTLARKDPYQKTFATVNLGSMKATGFNIKSFFRAEFLHLKKFAVENANVHLYRNKHKPLNVYQRKPLLQEALLMIPFDMTIDSIVISNSTLKVELLNRNFNEPAPFTFENIQATMAPVFNDQKRKDTMRFVSRSRFGKYAPFHFSSQFIFGHSSYNSYQGWLGSMPFSGWNGVISRFGSVTITSGEIQSIRFHGYCYDTTNKGSMVMLYKDLKLNIYNREKKQKTKKLVTFMGNMIIYDSNPLNEGEPPKEVQYTYYRKPFQGLLQLWLGGVLEGIANTAVDEQVREKVKQKFLSVRP